MSPYAFKLFIYLIYIVSGNSQPAVLLRSVMMDINYSIHIKRGTIINYILNTVYPRVIDCITIFIVNHIPPCNRNTNRIEPSVMNSLNYFLSCYNTLPCCFCRMKTCMTVHSIAKIPANTHFIYSVITAYYSKIHWI